MAKDIIKNALFKDGDFGVGFSDEQHVEDVLMTAPGHIKDHPLIGVGIMEYINSSLTPATVTELERKIRLNLEADGATNIKVSIDPVSQSIRSNGTYK